MGGMGVMGWEGRRRVLGRVDHGLVGNHSMREGGPESGRGGGLCGIVFGRHCTMELFFYGIAQLSMCMLFGSAWNRSRELLFYRIA